MILADDAGAGTSSHRLADRLIDHCQIIAGLAWREVQSRFGQNALGYAWTYVIPLLWIGGTYIVFTFMGRRSPVFTDMITFIISGLVPFLAFRLVIGSLGRVNGTVRGLVIYPGLTREHAAIAMALVEFINAFIVFAIVAALNFVLFGNWELDNALKFSAGVGLAWLLGAAYGYLFSTLALIDVTFQHVSGPLLRPTIFLSAIFFVANELPENLLRVFIYNPVLHAVEYARDGMLFHYESRVADPAYAFLWIFGMFGAALLVRVWRRG